MARTMRTTMTIECRLRPVPALLLVAVFVLVSILGFGDQNRATAFGMSGEMALASADRAPDGSGIGNDADFCGPGPGCLTALIVAGDTAVEPVAPDIPAPAAMAGVHARTGPPLDHPPIAS